MYNLKLVLRNHILKLNLVHHECETLSEDLIHFSSNSQLVSHFPIVKTFVGIDILEIIIYIRISLINFWIV